MTKLQRAVIFDGKEYGKEISLDTPTRWGSAYDMLSVVLQYREEVQAIMSAQQKEYSRLRRDGNTPRGEKTVEDKLLADTEWEMVETLQRLLAVPYALSKRLEGQHYPTLAQVVPAYV